MTVIAHKNQLSGIREVVYNFNVELASDLSGLSSAISKEFLSITFFEITLARTPYSCGSWHPTGWEKKNGLP